MTAGPTLSPEREAGTLGQLQPQVRLAPAEPTAGSDGTTRRKGGFPRIATQDDRVAREGVGMVSGIPVPTSAHDAWECNRFQTWPPSLSPSPASQAAIT